jgi:alkanesulfonate monooxygenase
MGPRDQEVLRIFSTCPQSRETDPGEYIKRVNAAARWSEAAGCEGMLVYSDNGILDAWLVSQLLVQATEHLSPLVAVQPIYMHPYTAAKMVSSLAYLHGRRTYLNMLAGGFRTDLIALDDDTEHDVRYARTVEYAQLIKALAQGTGPVTFEGRYYRVRNLRLAPPVPPEFAPLLTISGSSPAGLAAARALGAIAIKYPQPSHQETPQLEQEIESGMRIGVITREDAEAAWRLAYARFPEDRAGQIAHGLAMQVSDSQWHRRLSELAGDAAASHRSYWLGPYKNYKTFCPYLVGGYNTVATELRRYMELGFRTFILDIPASEEELWHTMLVFRLAQDATPA